jgi:hypothetical protein
MFLVPPAIIDFVLSQFKILLMLGFFLHSLLQQLQIPSRPRVQHVEDGSCCASSRPQTLSQTKQQGNTTKGAEKENFGFRNEN